MERKPLSYSIPWKSPTDGAYCIQGPFTKEDAEIRLKKMKKLGHKCENLVSSRNITTLARRMEFFLTLQGDKEEITLSKKDFTSMLNLISKEV